jgi:tRNA dimethylallyltransferase
VEVVSADSRQVYRGMDIGTAKPTLQERERVLHHLLDVVDPDQPFSLAQYQGLAGEAIEAVHARGCIPLLVGGTGLYIRAVLEGLHVPQVEPDPELRARLEAEAMSAGYAALHQRLRELDPVAAERIDARNVRRVVRALEVCYRMGQPMSSLQRASPPPYAILRIGLRMSRELLYRRIDERVERMIEAGLVEEVRSLVEQGYGYDLPAMSGLGYREIGAHLRGEITLPQAVTQIQWHTHRFVRQQATWFRADDVSIAWFEASPTNGEAVLVRIREFLAEK